MSATSRVESAVRDINGVPVVPAYLARELARELCASQLREQKLREALSDIMLEHANTSREVRETGNSDGLYMRPVLYLKVHEALSLQTDDSLASKLERDNDSLRAELERLRDIVGDEDVKCIDAVLAGDSDTGKYCQCWLCLNTGPNGECEKCGKPPSPERLKGEDELLKDDRRFEDSECERDAERERAIGDIKLDIQDGDL